MLGLERLAPAPPIHSRTAMKRIPREAPPWLIWLALAAAGAMTLKLVHRAQLLPGHLGLPDRTGATSPSTRSSQPHNEHIVVIPVLIEQALLRVFGMTSALPEYVLFTGSLLAVAYLLYRLRQAAARAPGSVSSRLSCVLCLGPAWEVLLWPFEIGFVGSMLFGLAMLLALEREDRRGDRWPASSLSSRSASPASACRSSSPAPSPSCRGRASSGAAAPTSSRSHSCSSPPGTSAGATTPNRTCRSATCLPRHATSRKRWRSRSATLFGLGTNPVGGLTDPVWGRALLVAVVGFFAYWIWRKPNVYRGFWPVAAAAATNWFLTAFNEFPGREPIASRYQYAGAIFILMLLANLMRDFRLDRRAVAVGAAVTALAVGPQPGRAQERQGSAGPADRLHPRRHEGDRDRRTHRRPGLRADAGNRRHPLADQHLRRQVPAKRSRNSAHRPTPKPSWSRRRRKAGAQADVILSQALPLSTVTRLGTLRARAPARTASSWRPAADRRPRSRSVPA